MVEPLLLTSSFLFGKELLSQTVSKTTTNIYNGLDELRSDELFQFSKLLETLDIKAKLEIIHEFINELTDSDRISHNYSKSIDKVLSYLCDILKKIEMEIDDIKFEIAIHKKKWFYKLRSPSYNIKINNLVEHLKILDERFELLLKLLK
jgi:hypothetical protein